MNYFYTLLFGMTTAVLHGQVASLYTFSQDTMPLSLITGGTLVVSGTFDDNTYTANNIGFTFNYNNTSYTQFGISINGYIVMGGNSLMSNYTPISGTNTNLISAMGADLQLGTTFLASGTTGSNLLFCNPASAGLYVGGRLIGNGIALGTTISAINGDTLTLSQNLTGTFNNVQVVQAGEIRYETLGTAPFRRCVIQWRSCSRFTSPAYYSFNFQIILHETTGKIETAYDVFETTAQSILAQVGLKGLNTTDYHIRQSNTSWQQTTAGTNAGDVVWLNQNSRPVSGLHFIWDNITSSVPESENPMAFTLFPNPASGQFTLLLSNAPQNTVLEIADLSGRLVKQQVVNVPTGSLQVSVADLPEGIYLVSMRSGNISANQKLIVSSL